jgi:4-oxalocrotonate tautomerase
MPHVVVKLWPGKSEQQKSRLAEEITKDVMSILHYGEESVSAAFEEVKPQDGRTDQQPYQCMIIDQTSGYNMR